MTGLCLNHLPDEVLLDIISYLDSRPLSTSQTRREPVDNIFTNAQAPLKALSRTCKRWRRLTLGFLTRHLVLDLHGLLDAAGASKPESLVASILAWCASVNNLRAPQTRVSLLVECVPKLARSTDLKILENVLPSIWQTLLQMLDPCRIVILAAYPDLLFLMGGGIHPTYDQFTSYLEELQILELDRKEGHTYSPTPLYDDLTDYGLATKARGLHSSMLHMRPWSHIGLNEGKVLDSSTFDYGMQRVHRSRESMIMRLFPRCCLQQATEHSHRWQHLRDEMSFIDSFSLTATRVPPDHLPSMRNTGGVHQWQFVRQLTLSLLPNPADVDLFHLPADEQANWWQARIDEALEHYCDLRWDLVNRYRQKDWRLRKVICLDDTVLRSYPVFVRKFETSMGGMFPGGATADSRDPRLKWGRVWEVVAGDHELELLKFTVHD
ncbi:hypothetical protein K461DRAFT_18862 [Myriangium duriaei CBS 260.36]|uniref:F-box domain-containing protein n=1 Tax=Myriangium duriaei CBS 260.36 TaxID=1168546 RepID=A0A9P4J9D3_9PEZI|nr:hypothetical protein K461DRAFT_18862 [Myriangium duriaei CBS 260.36]